MSFPLLFNKCFEDISHPPVVNQTLRRPHPLSPPLGGADFGFVFHHSLSFLLAFLLPPPRCHQTRPLLRPRAPNRLGNLASAHQGSLLQSVAERECFLI